VDNLFWKVYKCSSNEEISYIYGTRKFMTVFTTARYCIVLQKIYFSLHTHTARRYSAFQYQYQSHTHTHTHNTQYTNNKLQTYIHDQEFIS